MRTAKISILKSVSLIMTMGMSLCSIATAAQPNHWVLSLGAGMMTADPGRSQNFPIVDPETDSFYNYTAHHSDESHTVFTAFAGKEWTIRPQWLMQMGLNFSQSQNFHVDGALVQGADIQSADSYDYYFSVVTRQLLVESKFLFQRFNFVAPFAEIGLGVAANKAYNYTTTVPSFLTFTRQYNSHTQTSFSYALGAGLDINLTQQVRLGVEYRFTDLGKVQLGAANIDGIGVGGTLCQKHLLAHEVIAQLTWLI